MESMDRFHSWCLFFSLLCLCCSGKTSPPVSSKGIAAGPGPGPGPAPALEPALTPGPGPTPAPVGPPRLAVEEVAILKLIDSKYRIGWSFSVDPCSGANGWFYQEPISTNPVVRNVTCGNCDLNNTCHVVFILLKTLNLNGALPAELAKLKYLTIIDLTRNYFNGTIPREWGTLPNLVTLSIGSNRISGSIPDEIGNITTLLELVLDNNFMQGPLPSTLGKLKNLNKLSLSGNDFTGELPISLGNLQNLTDFRIEGTGISGRIPRFIGNWTKLSKLYMQGTNMEGPFPSEFSNLTSLSELQISDLKKGGRFPSLQDMKLKYIVLRNCSISDRLPEYVGSMNATLKDLDLSFNNFSGEIPFSFENFATKIDFMYLNNNNLTGKIPSWMLMHPDPVDLSYNFFSDSSAPKECGLSNQNVIASYSSSNNTSIDPCLRKNYPCVGNAANYEIFINCGGGLVNFENNQYEEDSLKTARSKYFISKSKKWAFSSTGNCPGLTSNFSYTFTNTSTLSMSDPDIYMTARLTPSSLNYYGLCLQRGNYTVKLHFAEIMFTSDQTYRSLGRRFFDVSIQGQKVLEDFNIVTEANGTGRSIIKSFNASVEDGTLEIGFRWSGKGTNAVPVKGVIGPLISAISVTPNFVPDIPKNASNSTPNDGKKRLPTGAIVGIVAGSCVGVLLIVLVLCFFGRKFYPGGNAFPGLVSNFSLKQIASATGNFDRANVIGVGGFGSVFKGKLPNGTLIAVKQLSSKSRQGNREFINEIGMISASEHPNLVKLFGCCVDRDQLFLVYEYMENNSLAHVLLGPEEARLKLDWKTRRKICLGIAKGLACLHDSRLRIIHRDIKAHNVLLDKDLNAKISDFGLATLYEDDDFTHMTIQIAGTKGYMAPEYATRGHLSDKVDVYSFGIVLLEIVSGKSNFFSTANNESLYILDWADELIESGKLLGIVDENLESEYPVKEVEQMIRLALLCTNASPTLRPAMSKVVSILESGEYVEIPLAENGISKSKELKLKTFLELLEDDTGMTTTQSGGYSMVSSVATTSTEPLMPLAMSAVTGFAALINTTNHMNMVFSTVHVCFT